MATSTTLPTPTISRSLEPFLSKVAACNQGVAQKHTLTQLFIAEELVGYMLPEYDLYSVSGIFVGVLGRVAHVLHGQSRCHMHTQVC